MLGTLDPDSKRDWKTHVGPLVHAYNCTQHESTGQSPFFLMFGRHPRLPVDIAFGLDIEPSKPKSVLKYTKSLQDRLKQAYDLAAEMATKAQERQKTKYDQKARAAVLESESGEGKRRTLHRNLLLPIGTISNQAPSVPTPAHPARPIPAPRRKPATRAQTIKTYEPEETDDSEDESVMIPIHTSRSSASTVRAVDRPAEGEESAEEIEEVDIMDTEDTDETAQDHEQEDTPSPDPGSGEETSPERDIPDVPEPTPRQDPEDDSSGDIPSAPSPRRLTRERHKPKWMRSEEYVLSAQPQPEWMTRASYLSFLIVPYNW
ncbi:protein TsetseEP-like [Haliotis rufescens]|uniref:protein TsetseEP-like n=1 Tax=Haliotis rufescens TaxID=6454 RepID=UPI00201F3A91|nr:protein TsetseEP-like [Haliotis rufescens]